MYEAQAGTEVLVQTVTHSTGPSDLLTFSRSWPWSIMASEGRGSTMIRVTTMDGRQLVINSDLIETIQATPDTVITLLDGKKLIVKDPVEDLINRIVEFRHRVLAWPADSADKRS